MNLRDPLPFGDGPLSVWDVEDLAYRRRVVGDIARAAVARSERARAHLLDQLTRGGVVYGVTTGFGDSCETRVEGDLTWELPRNLFRFHGCGLGEAFAPETTRAILACRLASLTTGYSAVRGEVLERLRTLLERDVLPTIYEIGSVGASGDLTPLSYVAAVLAGEGEVLVDGHRLPTPLALAELGLEPLVLEPKESLALMNGTSAMTGLAALLLPRALRLTRWAAALTACASEVLLGEPRHFDARLFVAKPHPGQARIAAFIRADLATDGRRAAEAVRVQDRYSIRCAPHVLGVLLDSLPWMARFVEIELNGANDNPLVDPETGDILHGGNFYGGHIASAMDTLKTLVANVADLLDRQLALLCNPTTNHGLPANLVGASALRFPAHHGFKAMQITASALAAEALKATMPASVFSRSTENHNQDKVSMGTIASRDAARVLELTEQLAAIVTLAALQAHDLRGAVDGGPRLRELHAFVRTSIPKHEEDRPMREDILRVVEWARREELPIGALPRETLYEP